MLSAVGQVLTAGKDNLLKLVDARTFEIRQVFRAARFSVGTIWCTPAISPDEQHVAAGATDGTVHIWEVRDQQWPTVAVS